uniref:Uncharacterized protein n=1 Tax=Oryza glumipatula TaxID=40148 RepID=A0A0E0BQJ8_9ORYZ
MAPGGGTARATAVPGGGRGGSIGDDGGRRAGRAATASGSGRDGSGCDGAGQLGGQVATTPVSNLPSSGRQQHPNLRWIRRKGRWQVAVPKGRRQAASGSGGTLPSTGFGGMGGGGQWQRPPLRRILREGRWLAAGCGERRWRPSLCRIGWEGRWWVAVAPSPMSDPARGEAGGGSERLPLMFPGLLGKHSRVARRRMTFLSPVTDPGLGPPKPWPQAWEKKPTRRYAVSVGRSSTSLVGESAMGWCRREDVVEATGREAALSGLRDGDELLANIEAVVDPNECRWRRIEPLDNIEYAGVYWVKASPIGQAALCPEKFAT